MPNFQAVAIFEARGDLPRETLIDVRDLVKAYPHPICLLTRLLEHHIETSVLKFDKANGQIADIEHMLRKDLSSSQKLSHADETLQTHQELNAKLHKCSIDVADLEKRRHFEKEMGVHVDMLITSINRSYITRSAPQACLDIKQRMGLFQQIAESRDLDLTSLPRRISTQMNVLYNQIAQRCMGKS